MSPVTAAAVTVETRRAAHFVRRLAACAIASFACLGTARADIVVPRDFPTIQAAIDAASPGATVRVRPGTYVEELVIAKDVTIKGAGHELTIIKAPPTLTAFGRNTFNGRSLGSIVRVTDGARAAIAGVTVTGPLPCGMDIAGVRALKDATLELSDSRVASIRPGDLACDISGALSSAVTIGLVSFFEVDGQLGSTAHGRISHVIVEDFLVSGIVVLGPAGGPTSTAKIANNRIFGGSPFGASGSGVSLGGAAIAQVTDNQIRAMACTRPECGRDPINEFQAAGIGANGLEAAGTVIRDNAISASDIGIYLAASTDCCRTQDNSIVRSRYFGIVVQDGSNTLRENLITGGEVGIAVVADAVDSVGTLIDNEIRRTTVKPVQEISCCGFSAKAIVRR